MAVPLSNVDYRRELYELESRFRSRMDRCTSGAEARAIEDMYRGERRYIEMKYADQMYANPIYVPLRDPLGLGPGAPVATTTPPPAPTTQPKVKPKVEPKPIEQEFIVAPIVGWRKWGAGMFTVELRSAFKTDYVWPIRKRMESKCEAKGCSGLKCNCGIHAHKTVDQVRKEYESSLDPHNSILGEVYLWGKVLECEKGFRAQYAYPKAFVNTGNLAQEYAQAYGVPLINAPEPQRSAEDSASKELAIALELDPTVL